MFQDISTKQPRYVKNLHKIDDKEPGLAVKEIFDTEIHLRYHTFIYILVWIFRAIFFFQKSKSNSLVHIWRLLIDWRIDFNGLVKRFIFKSLCSLFRVFIIGVVVFIVAIVLYLSVFHTFIWYKVFLYDTNYLNTVVWFQVYLLKLIIIRFQVIISI